MSVEENKANIVRMVGEIWNKGNLDLIPDLCSQDYIEPMGERNIEGHEGIRQHVSSLRNALSDFHMDIDEMVGEGDTIAVRLTWSGTFRNAIWGMEPNHREVRVTEAVFFRFDNGKQAGAIPFTDLSSLFRQMSPEL